jgi:hypothetical protein
MLPSNNRWDDVNKTKGGNIALVYQVKYQATTSREMP